MISTAVILASGFGGRRMPVVSVIQKEMIPILNRPTIDYVVADCVAAGLNRIIFVVRPDISQIKEYYTHPIFLPEQYKNITFEFVERSELHGNGTASALKAAFPLLDDAPFVVCAGDGFMYGEETGYVKYLLDFETDMALLTTICVESELYKYGVLGGDLFITEKPLNDPPSNVINVSQYIFTPKIIPYVTNLAPVDGEYRLTDAINALVQDGGTAETIEAGGEYFDTGDVFGWLKANRRMEPFEYSKVLVVGGDGFIGSHLPGWDVIDLKRGSDVRDGIKEKYSTIVFLACDIAQTQNAYDYNESLYEALDKYMQQYPDTHVIYSSSAAVYSDSDKPQKESIIPNPPNIYGKSKLLGEIYVQKYRRHTILRFSNVYGNGEGNGVIDQFKRGIKPVGNPDCVRDYVPVESVVKCIEKAVLYPDDWFGITNVSSGKGMTVREVWRMVNGDKPFKSQNTRTGDVSYSVLDNARMIKLL